MYKQVKGLFQRSRFTNLTIFEKLFSNSNLWFYSFNSFITAIIIIKARRRQQKNFHGSSSTIEKKLALE